MNAKTEVKLTPISEYTKDQVLEASNYSEAIKRYLSFLNRRNEFDLNNSFFILRLERHQYWLECALATFFKTHSTKEICEYWSQSADILITKAWEISGLSNQPLSLFALGKLGSQELNLSSDVDIVIYSQIGSNKEIEKSLRLFQSLLSEITEIGQCLRLDFDLRPGGRLSPIICTAAQMENYYWSLGETWERLALIRLRPICGNLDLIKNIFSVSTNYIYRKFLDYTLFEDLKNLRQRIRQFYPEKNSAIHLKLGTGGIRDVELFIHSLQVIHGGKDQIFRTHSTENAILILSDHNILSKSESQFLLNSYWELRHIENLVQLKNDRQTHELDDELAIGLNINKSKITELMNDVNKLVSTLLGEQSQLNENIFDLNSAQVKHWFIDKKFDPNSATFIWEKLSTGSVKSSKKQRDEIARKNFLHNFINAIDKVGLDKDLALESLFEFTQSLSSKATFFTLFNREPRLVEDLAALFSCSPYLTSYLISRPELIDSFIYRSLSDFSLELEPALEEMTDYRMLSEIILAQSFLKDKNLLNLTDGLTHCADYISNHLLKLICEEFNMPFKILALGKWGAKELGFRSDLDLMFVSENTPSATDQKLARRFINRITEHHRGGRMYSIDMRLKPSGFSGPLILSIDQLNQYLSKNAKPWERQAYLRARWIDPTQSKFEINYYNQGLSKEDLLELREIKQKLLTHPQKSFDLKLQPGGLIDTELAIQTLILNQKLKPNDSTTKVQLECLIQDGQQDKKKLNKLFQIYSRLRTIEQQFQLLFNRSGSEISFNDLESSSLSKRMRASNQDLTLAIQNDLLQSTEILKEVDPTCPYI